MFNPTFGQPIAFAAQMVGLLSDNDETGLVITKVMSVFCALGLTNMMRLSIEYIWMIEN